MLSLPDSCRQQLAQLPIHTVLADIRSCFQSGHELVLQAPPGAGKTTSVPLALLDERWLGDGKILLLEPRRIAARNAAQRMADLLDEKVGERVGYRMRMDTRVGPRTQIEVITEGVLTRMLQADPSLEGIAMVIFDECHERNLNTDLGLALCLQGRALFRDTDNPLRLLAMSATLDAEALSTLLNHAPVVTSEGRQYPVTLNYRPQRPHPRDLVDAVTETTLQALSDTTDSVLVFLPGQREIHQVQQRLQSSLSGGSSIDILPLYGSLPLTAQQAAIRHQPSRRKVVLATDIAETSLTINGVHVVVDSGLARKPVYDPTTAMVRLQTQRISQASATQRMGRAGRLGPGFCYRLWPQDQQQQLARHSTAEILDTDLTALALQLLSWGVGDPTELDWLDPPPAAGFQQALDLLVQLQAVHITQGQPKLSSHGEKMAQMPTHPRLAHMLTIAHQAGHTRTAAAIAALLSERLPNINGSRDGLDDYLELLAAGKPKQPPLMGWYQRCRQQQKQFEQLCHAVIDTAEATAQPLSSAAMVALAYPDRIARQRTDNGTLYQLANGRQAMIANTSALRRHTWLAVAEISGQQTADGKSRDDHIRLANPIDLEQLESLMSNDITSQDTVYWNNKDQRLIAERRQYLGQLMIRSRVLNDLPDDQRLLALHHAIEQQGLDLLPWTPTLRQWQQRVMLLCDADNDSWPDVSDSGLNARLHDWFDPYAARVTNARHLAALPLADMLSSLLPWPLPQQLDEQAPTHLTVPSGSRIALDYGEPPPVLAVKLQEMFGATQTPTIANGRVAVKLHLLSPAGRPLQVTQDLAAFWANGYDSVKKEMKGRYPKHPWPDDPLTFKPTAKTKRHLKNN
ncbi:RNA helicase CrhR [BD1-7 clade bacterium]|uniref:RNA helicase CrhR n=1 Tax=BD1-7 clade bacterium TaxID=2029982 RepID=A0A5S9MZW8_9GAMM|nr:RNA helicase CrhR [BD1-7 clade bacterium]CAA0082792.1 RNA helicase CrhR [BD1-7 clade bacterium]